MDMSGICSDAEEGGLLLVATSYKCEQMEDSSYSEVQIDGESGSAEVNGAGETLQQEASILPEFQVH